MKIFLLTLSLILITGLYKIEAQVEPSDYLKRSVNVQAYYSDPAISPDGSEIAFVSGGDIWTVSSKGGTARLLVANSDYDSRPLYSPDGRYLAFNSTRSGNGDIYTLDLKSGDLKRLTYDDGNDEISSWSDDGAYIYFATASHDISAMRDVFRIRSGGGTPMAVSDNRFMNEFFASPSPDGKTIAFDARGVASHQWWRNGRSHLDESEIWLLHDGKKNDYERITKGGAKDLWPMWSKDAASIYFVSDRTGTQNLWVSAAGNARQLTRFTKGRVVWPSIAHNGESIVFERDFKIWKYNIGTGSAEVVAIDLLGSASGQGVEHLKLQNQFRDLSLSPDGKKVAFIAHGEVFVVSSREGGDAFRVTHSISRESQIIWTSNSSSLIYSSERDSVAHLYQYNFIGARESQLTNGTQDDMAPLLSPNGKLLSFVRGGTELHVMELAAKTDITVAKGYFGRPPFASAGSISWSPDNKWIAYAGTGVKTFRNIFVVPAAGGSAPKAVSFLANTFGGKVSWSANGKFILFSTSQRTENTFIARVDLVPQTPRFREEQFQQLFNEQITSPSSPVNPMGPRVIRDTSRIISDTPGSQEIIRMPAAPVTIQMEGIRQRLNFLSLGVDINEYELNKDGTLMVLSATLAGQTNLYTYSLDESSRESARGESSVLKQLTTTPGIKSNPQFSTDGKEVYYLEQGRIQSVALDSKLFRSIAVTAEMDVDFEKEKVEVFREAWEALNKGFYNPQFNGVNWKAVRTEYEPLAEGAGTPEELRRILSLMVGELNSSHSGVSGPIAERGAGGGSIIGKTGLRFDRKEYEENGRFKIIESLTLGPVDITGKIKTGDYLIAIDEKMLGKQDNIDKLLENKVGRRVMLTIASSSAATDAKKIAVRPINMATEKGLLYKQWVEQQREYVSKISNGRLGYIHMADMSEQSLNQLYIDMDAENHSREGVVVDVRNNNGGFVNGYALDVFARKNYLTMTGRGMPSAPARVQLGQRALDAPTILVTNQHSLSDAEDFTEGYRALKLGKVVGEPTGGWIIFTSSAQLIDGSSVRLPFSKIEDHEGKNMEMVPRPVDIFVSRQLGEGADKDSQLDVAVKELLDELGSRKKKNGF